MGVDKARQQHMGIQRHRLGFRETLRQFRHWPDGGDAPLPNRHRHPFENHVLRFDGQQIARLQERGRHSGIVYRTRRQPAATTRLATPRSRPSRSASLALGVALWIRSRPSKV